MNYLKSKYIQHLTPGLTFKTDYGSIICVVNNKKVLYIHYGGNGTVISYNQNGDWPENWYKLGLVDKKLLKKFNL